MDLHNKVVIITGAKGGLGTFVTNSFLEAGAHVVGVSRSIAQADFSQKNFSALSVELSSVENARRLADSVTAERGRIDALVHLMGGFAGGQSVAATDDGTLDRMLDLNLRSAFHMIRRCFRKCALRVWAESSRSAVRRQWNRQRCPVPMLRRKLLWCLSSALWPARTATVA